MFQSCATDRIKNVGIFFLRFMCPEKNYHKCSVKGFFLMNRGGRLHAGLDFNGNLAGVHLFIPPPKSIGL